MDKTGATHQGLLDMAFFRLVPNLTIMAPKDFKELEDMLELAISLGKPVVVRYPRGGEAKEKFEKHSKIKYGKSEIIKTGKDISIIAIGKTVERALKVSKMLENDSIEAEVINARFLKPFDNETIKESKEKKKKVITIEDGTIINGLATTVKELIIEKNIKDVEIQNYSYPDKFIEHGNVEELEKLYKQDAEFIYSKILTLLN